MLQIPRAMACDLLFGLLLLMVLAAHSQGNHLGPTSRLRYSRFLDPSNVIFLRWDFDLEAEMITFELQVQTDGWVGLGVTNGYTFVGADLVVGGVLPDGNVYFSVSWRVTFFQGCRSLAGVHDGFESSKDPQFPNMQAHAQTTSWLLTSPCRNGHWRDSV